MGRVREDFSEPAEEALTKAFSRIVAIDSRRWIEFLLEVLPRLMEVRFAELPAVQLRMMRMFYITVWQKYGGFTGHAGGAYRPASVPL